MAAAAAWSPSRGSPSGTSEARRGPRRRHESQRRVLSVLAACVLIPLLLLNQVVAVSPDVSQAVASDPRGSLTLLTTLPGALVDTSASPRQNDYDDDDYNDAGDDYDDDYDYYGTKQKKKKKKKKPAAPTAITLNETNAFNFVRIMVLRLVWGLASLFGFDEPLSEMFGGAFVPPGVDVDDDGLGFDY